MDEATASALLATLIERGLIEEREGGELGPTRRWNARLQAAAEKLNQLVVQRDGIAPEGNPLMLAITQALLEEKLDLPPAAFDDAVRLLTLLELTRMKPEKRAQMGFGDVTF